MEQLSDRGRDTWNQWVSAHPNAHFYHLWEWGEVLSLTYDYQRFYLAVKSEEGIVGVFPIVLIRSRVFNSKLVSLPFCEYGGPLLTDSLNSSDANAAIRLLLKATNELMKKLKVDYLEMRQPPLSPITLMPEFSSLERYLTFRINLADGESEVWKSMDRKCRNAIQKARKSGVKIVQVDREHLPHYYGLYLGTEKRLGSPPHSQVLFTNIFDAFQNKRLARMILATYDGKAIGGIIVFCFNSRMYWWNNVTDRKLGALNPTNILLWHVIQWGGANNFRTFDMGRTRFETPGIYHFKRSWGGKRVSLKDYIVASKEVKLPDPLQWKYLMLSRIWSRLPLTLAKRLGPSLVSGLGL